MSIDMSEITAFIESQIIEHMDNQPFKIECMKCKEELTTHLSVDGDYDLIILVETCPTCLKEVEEIAG
jgi:hypothetical protein